ncbi:hypothetical protein D3C76_449490 [compost metagenome]
MGDGRYRTFVDVDLQGDAVARLRDHFGFDRGRIATLGDILALQLVAHAFEGGTLEDFTFSQPRLLEALHQVVLGDRLVALDLDAGDRRTLDHVDDEDIAVAPQLDVLEETGLEQRTGRFDQSTVVDLIAHVQGKGGEYATSGNTLQAIDPDIGDCEGLGVNLGDHHRGNGRG